MKVLVTGAAGFIGSHIVPRLVSEGMDVTCIDTPEGYAAGRLKGIERKVHLITADITQPSLFDAVSEPLDTVLHLAALASPILCDQNPPLAFLLNVNGTHNVLKLALKCRAEKVVFASTAHVYGISPRYMPTDERHPLWLQDTYTTTKILGEQLCQLFYENHGLSYLTLRLYNGYGPGQPTGYFIPDIIRKAQAGQINLKGGEVTKDFVFVSDVASAFVKAVSSEYVGNLNIGSGRETRLKDVASTIAQAFGVQLTPVLSEGSNPTRMLCDWTRALKILEWRPKVSLEEGLRRTIETWR